MRSHTTLFTRRDLATVAGAPIVVLLTLSGMLWLAAALGWLPAPRPTLDMDRTLLVHQADASRAVQDAHLILVGDSSCLMDVSATDLTQQLGQPALNLGLLSYLDLPGFGALVRNYGQANPGQLRTVVLLLHPESLRLQTPSAYHRAQLAAYLTGRDAPSPGSLGARVQSVLGADLVRGRLLARVLPAPLPGVFGRLYGFTDDFARALASNRGSAIDPGRFERVKAQGNAEYRLAKRLEVESRQFRECVPSGVRLAVGLTPAPSSFVGPDHAATCCRLLEQWAGWLKADLTLTGLPVTLPDDQFASVTHLNREGRQRFTAALATTLRQAPPR
jgi:hypothetical protein